jgi:HSP90 family molecular chaperone
VEVLLLGEGVDNWMVSSLREFDSKKLQSVAQGAGEVSLAYPEEVELHPDRPRELRQILPAVSTDPEAGRPHQLSPASNEGQPISNL